MLRNNLVVSHLPHSESSLVLMLTWLRNTTQFVSAKQVSWSSYSKQNICRAEQKHKLTDMSICIYKNKKFGPMVTC